MEQQRQLDLAEERTSSIVRERPMSQMMSAEIPIAKVSYGENCVNMCFSNARNYKYQTGV